MCIKREEKKNLVWLLPWLEKNKIIIIVFFNDLMGYIRWAFKILRFSQSWGAQAIT